MIYNKKKVNYTIEINGLLPAVKLLFEKKINTHSTEILLIKRAFINKQKCYVLGTLQLIFSEG